MAADAERETGEAPNRLALPIPPARLELRAALLLILLLVLLGGFLIYVLYARGAFEATQRLVLVTDDSEGLSVGMDVTFSGFPIGRVRRFELAEDGKVSILVDVPRKDARWLRSSSVFTIERGLVGETRIRAFSGVLEDPPLPENAVRSVLRGDTAAELPRLVATARTLLDNLERMSPRDRCRGSRAGLRRLSRRALGGAGRRAAAGPPPRRPRRRQVRHRGRGAGPHRRPARPPGRGRGAAARRPDHTGRAGAGQPDRLRQWLAPAAARLARGDAATGRGGRRRGRRSGVAATHRAAACRCGRRAVSRARRRELGLARPVGERLPDRRSPRSGAQVECAAIRKRRHKQGMFDHRITGDLPRPIARVSRPND